MIHNTTIAAMFAPLIFSFLFFVGLIIFYKKRIGVSVKPIVVGAIGFFVFTQVLEKILHLLVVTNFPNYADHPWLFGMYGGLAAGIFEEIGRFILFTWLLKKYHDYKDGISFGIGWGGIEAILLMLTMILPNIIFAFMINAGTFEKSLAGQMPADQLVTIKETLLSQGASHYLWGIFERFFAVFLQIFLSLLVLLGVVKKKFSYVIFAVFLHAVIDFPLVFFQTGHVTSLWIVEVYVALLGILSMIFIQKSKKWFEQRDVSL